MKKNGVNELRQLLYFSKQKELTPINLNVQNVHATTNLPLVCSNN